MRKTKIILDVRLLVICGMLVGVVAAEAPAADAVPAALQNYVSQADDSFSWKLRSNDTTDQFTVYDVELTSQTWQGIVWRHALQVFEPAEIRYPGAVLLFVNGGRNGQRPGSDRAKRGLKLAQLTQARCAFLYQVPNQPLLGDRVEDDLISETF